MIAGRTIVGIVAASGGASRGRRAATALACAVVLLLQLAPAAAPDPVLVLVSIDGWRWDYTDRPPARNLRSLAARGVRVRELIPSFPPITFPNHYTIVTGLYPEHHGIVANSIIDPATGRRFSMRTAEKTDPMWWGGEPLWVTAASQGRRTAALFWPGSEGAIQGVRPTYWKPYDTHVPAAARIQQAIDWLRLPDRQRPSLIAIYLEDVDHAGHDFGPDSKELARAATVVDRSIGALVAAIASMHMDDRTTVVVVSDHGMTALSDARVIWLDDYLDVRSLDVTEWEGLLLLAPKPATPETVAEVYARLRTAHPRLHVFTRENIPARFHYSENPRIAPIIGIPDDGWTVTTRARREQRRQEGRPPQRGTHGYDPEDRNMHALFIAAGPELKRGFVAPALDNVDAYDFFCRILKLKPAPNDGNERATESFFRK
jgi:predicted AlkP superfamily pyrophosphatase or phosphodiesterase